MKKVRDGYKMTELGPIPEEWEVKEIKQLYTILTGATPLRKKHNEYFLNGDIPWVKTLDLNDRYVYSTDEKITDLAIRETSCKLQDINTVLIAMYGGFNQIGRTGILKIKGATNQAICSLPPIEEMCSEYLNYYLIANRAKWKGFAASSRKDPNITKSDVENFKILVPKLSEQYKIADIISSVDEQIENTDNLIEKTNELKKGLMQRLLTKGIGHDRFKNTEIGWIPEEWEVRSLCDLSEGKGEYGIGAVATEYFVGNPRYLRITDIGDESKLLFNDIKGLEEQEYERYILKQNDIVFARTGNTTGKSYVYNIEDGDLVYAGFLIKFSINPKLANVNFIKYIIQSERYWNWVNMMSTRSGQPGINSSEYSKLLIQVPTIEEQKQISIILSSVDEQINKYEAKKEKLHELKKGLMHKLLTGTIRVQ